MITRLHICIVLFLLLQSIRGASAGEGEASESLTVIGVVPLSTAGVNQDSLHHVDRLVPELRKVSQERVILLECRYSSKSHQERDVLRAFTIAAQVEKYLREHHKLNVELWIAAHPKHLMGKDALALTFSASQSYRDLDRMQADLTWPAMNK